MKDTLKGEIDDMFLSRYRFDFITARHEELNIRTGQWQESMSSEQYLLRFLMQWLLVASPPCRQNALDLYGSLLLGSSALTLAKQTFESPNAWDDQWSKFGHPSVRNAENLGSKNAQGTLYYVAIDQELRDWGQLYQFEKPAAGHKIRELAVKRVPDQLKQQIFKDTLALAARAEDEGWASHQKMIGDCYSIGFGIPQNTDQALSWYEKSSTAGNVDGTEAFLRTAGPTLSCKRLGLPTYCQWLCRVLLSILRLQTEVSVDRNRYFSAIDRLEYLLCARPELSRASLEKAFNDHISNTRAEKVANITGAQAGTETPAAWIEALKAIRNDDQEALRKAILTAPTIVKGRPDGFQTLAHIAAENNRAGILRMLIDDFNIDCRVECVNGLSPLARAVRLGNTASARVILFSQKDVELEGGLAAMDAGAEGNRDLTALLFDRFAGPQQSSQLRAVPNTVPGLFGRWSFFSLASAILNNSWSVFCTLLAIGVDPNISSLPEISRAESFFAGTLLASTSYNPIMLAALLAFDGSPHIRIPAPDGRTALHLACGGYFNAMSGWDNDGDRPAFTRHWSLSRIDVPEIILSQLQSFTIWVLLNCGAGIEAPNHDGLTPLAYAIQHGKDSTAAKVLLDRKWAADIDAPDFSGSTPLHRAFENGDLMRLELILRYGANIEAQNFLGETVLCKAVKQGDTEMCKELLRWGANIRTTDANGQNCLHVAVLRSKLEIVRLFEQTLLSHSQEAFEQTLLDRDCRGWSALHTAILVSGADDRFARLFEKWVLSVINLDLDAQDALGWTMLHIASSASVECARVLLENGASVDIKDSILGWTPMHHACSEGNHEMWNLLLAYGADFFLRDDLMGWTPMTLMERAVDALRLESGESFAEDSGRIWVGDGGEPVDEDGNEWEDDVSESSDVGDRGSDSADPVLREILARRRAAARVRVSRFFAEESMRRITRPVRQDEHDRDVDLARARVFPEHRYLEEASPEIGEPCCLANSRNLKKAFMVNRSGNIRKWERISPASSSFQSHNIWLVDPYGVAQR